MRDKGRYIGLEVKALKTKQNDNQKEFQAAVNAAGGIYFLVRSLEEAVEAIEDAIERRHPTGILDRRAEKSSPELNNSAYHRKNCADGHDDPSPLIPMRSYSLLQEHNEL